MKLTAFTQIIVTLAVTAWVFILPVEAVATILVLELALLLYIKHDRMTMAAIGGLAVFTGMMILLQLLFGSPLDVSLTGGLRMLVMTMAFLCLLAASRIQDIAKALEVVQKGSQEELVLKLRQLDMQREAEIDAAEKTGEDVFAIDQKFASKKQQILEENAAYQVQLIAENAAAEQIVRDQQYQTDMLALKKQLAERQITQKEFAEREYLLTLDYVQKTNEAAIDALELELQADNLSAEDRKKIAEELQRLKAEFAQKEAEAEISAIEKVAKADDKAHKDRMRSLQNWLQTAQQAIGNIGDLIATVYDGQITKIEDEQDANDEAYDRDIERIEKQVEYGVLSEEEAEIRKRAAKEKTEAKNRELEKKKQDLARKQAIWDKATSIAQAGIATALAITKSLPNFVLAAIVGAMGAIQVATIAATPIPSYAEGTKTGAHPGGKALVGDAGKREVVMYKGLAWITPDTPMLVDLPKGAQVFPDVNDFGPVDWQKDSFVVVCFHLSIFEPLETVSAPAFLQVLQLWSAFI